MIDLFGTDIAPAAIVLVLVLLGLMKGEESDHSYQFTEATLLVSPKYLAFSDFKCTFVKTLYATEHHH